MKINLIDVQNTMDFGEWGGAAKFCDDLHFKLYSAHIYTKTKSHHLRYDSRSAKTNVTWVARTRALSAHIYTRTKSHHLQHESRATPQLSHELMLASLAPILTIFPQLHRTSADRQDFGNQYLKCNSQLKAPQCREKLLT